MTRREEGNYFSQDSEKSKSEAGATLSQDWVFRRSTIVSVIACLFIIILTIVLYLGYRHLESAKTNALNSDKTTAALLSSLILENEKAAIRLLQSYASRPLFIDAVKRKDVRAARLHLDDLKRNPEVDLIFLTDVQGILWINAPWFPEAIGKNVSYIDWYKGVSSKWQPYVSALFQVIGGDRHLAIAIAVPVLDEQGKPIGILASTQRLSFLANIISSVSLSPNTKVHVIDRTGTIIYSNNFSYQNKITTYPALPIIAPALQENERQVVIDDRQGIIGKRFLPISPVKEIGWSVIIEREFKDIVQAQYRHLVEIMTTGLFLFLLISFFLIYLRQVFLLRKTLALMLSEKWLQESEARYRSLFENMVEGFAYCQMFLENGKPHDFIYLEVNHAFERLTGLTHVEGKKVSDVIPGIQATDKELLDLYGRVASECKPERVEIYVNALDMWFSISVYCPRKEYFVAVFDVITERKNAEKEIRILNEKLEQKVAVRTKELQDSQLALLNLVDDLNQSAKSSTLANQALEATNKELEAFSYSVSHDLRAPLRSIDGFSQALLEDYQKKLDDTGRNYLERIRRAIRHMSQLIDDMLKLSWVTRSAFRRESVDLSKMFREIIKKSQKYDPARIVGVSIQKGIIIEGDRDLMRIVLTNLIDNAWKFTGRKARPKIEFGMTNQAGKKAVFIRDNGVGFDMTYVGKLFGTFQRLHTTAEFPGTGIGLATIQRIIHRHGGQVWAEGEVGKGATFYFTLPE